ncbi:uncharacterized protein BXZ73DRAFT_100020 [Epithele typhae]|uniref:uncharacterized protein n=1 Tax=Epithele typhae TaxID=378194 RepID=UPI00200834FD|nr:uncharacterized protein BXZ73DRAFT_100020 [Epithele typhae]KAH9937806.1 hypothetical protein BXZ73DRAFT_100020 [Epithele typhae]
MRLYASYQQNTIVLVIICALYALEVLVGVIAGTIIVSSVEVMERPEGFPIPGCLLSRPKHPKLGVASWGIAVAVTCIYFLLILNKFARTITLFKPSNEAVPLTQLRRISPVIYYFLRDSVLYFLLVFSGNLMSLLFEIKLQDRALRNMSSTWLAAIYAVSVGTFPSTNIRFLNVYSFHQASRLILNTRRSVQRHKYGWALDPQGHPMTNETDTIELNSRETWADDAPLSPCSPQFAQTPRYARDAFGVRALSPWRDSVGSALPLPPRASPSLSGRARGSWSSFAILSLKRAMSPGSQTLAPGPAHSAWPQGGSSVDGRGSRMSPFPQDLMYVAPWIIFEREDGK